MTHAQETEVIVLGGGCFWCTEAIYKNTRGVIEVMPGYCGGHIKNPSYKMVTTGETGHAEVVQVKFDPKKINRSQILDIFFATHDPTSLNRQGADVGTQYRSVIFYADEKQYFQAKAKIDRLNTENTYGKKVVTTLEPFKEFYPAEKEHWDYFARNPSQAYCVYVIRPKVDKFKKDAGKILEMNNNLKP